MTKIIMTSILKQVKDKYPDLYKHIIEHNGKLPEKKELEQINLYGVNSQSKYFGFTLKKSNEKRNEKRNKKHRR